MARMGERRGGLKGGFCSRKLIHLEPQLFDEFCVLCYALGVNYSRDYYSRGNAQHYYHCRSDNHHSPPPFAGASFRLCRFIELDVSHFASPRDPPRSVPVADRPSPILVIRVDYYLTRMSGSSNVAA